MLQRCSSLGKNVGTSKTRTRRPSKPCLDRISRQSKDSFIYLLLLLFMVLRKGRIWPGSLQRKLKKPFVETTTEDHLLVELTHAGFHGKLQICFSHKHINSPYLKLILRLCLCAWLILHLCLCVNNSLLYIYIYIYMCVCVCWVG